MPSQALVVNLADQRPKQSKTHSSTFPQDSDSYFESDIELRSTHTSPEITTSEELDGTLVDTSMSTTPYPPLSGEGDLDSTEGHSQLSVGTLPLTDKDPSEEHNKETVIKNKETVITPPFEELEHVVGTPPSPHIQDSPTEYPPPKENPKAPLDSEEGLGVPLTKKSQSVPPDNPVRTNS